MDISKLSFINFIDAHVSVVSEKYKAMCIAYFDAITSGKEDAYKKSADAQLAREKIYSNKDDFAKIKEFIAANTIDDSVLKRQLEILSLLYQAKQVDENKLQAVISLQNKIESEFSIFRAELNGKKVTENDIKEILANSTSSDEVQEVRLAGKTVGNAVFSDVIQIVKMRNEIAKELWYNNYHEMSLMLDEQNPEEISQLFDELDVLTRDAFIKEKELVDIYLANKFSIKKEELMPRHYQDPFFQEAPKIYSTNIDYYYKDKDIVELSRSYYNDLGMSVDDILSNSDVYEREGKYQHACCIHIDKMGDVRIVCNIKQNAKRMSTQLHELWHAVYDKYLDFTIPYILRDPAHTFTTEAIAMMFGRFATNPQWIQDMIWISDDEKLKISNNCFDTLRLEQLVFSRRAQVMYRFEKSMYEDPTQDLNILRRDLVEKYQMLQRPKGRDTPDRASKIHVSCYPCYYHNYLLWELLASQIYYHIIENVLHSSEYQFQSFFKNKNVGDYLKENIFAAGRVYPRNTMIEKATWEKLTPKYYAKQFVK